MKFWFLNVILMAMWWSSAIQAGPTEDAFVKICIENRNDFGGAVAAWNEVFKKKKEAKFSDSRSEHRFMASESLKRRPESYVTVRFNAKKPNGRVIECSVVDKQLVYSAERDIEAEILDLIETSELTPKDEAARKKWVKSVDQSTKTIRGGQYDWITRLAPDRIVEIYLYPNEGSVAFALGASVADIPTLDLSAFTDVEGLSSSIADLFIETCVQKWGDDQKIREILKEKHQIDLAERSPLLSYHAANDVGSVSNYMIRKEFNDDSFVNCIANGLFEDAIFHVRYLKSKLSLKAPAADSLYSLGEMENVTASGARIRKFWLLPNYPNLVLSVEAMARAANKRPDTLTLGIGLRRD